MKAVSFYHRESGLLNGTHLLSSDESAVKLNTPIDHVAIEGHHDPLRRRVNVETGELIDYQPPPPSADHVWDDGTKTWQLSAAAAAKIERRRTASGRIAFLESSQHRVVRELNLHLAGVVPLAKDDLAAAQARLKSIHDEISALRADL